MPGTYRRKAGLECPRAKARGLLVQDFPIGIHVRETLPTDRNRFRASPVCGDYMARWAEPESRQLVGAIKWCLDLLTRPLVWGHNVQGLFEEERDEQ